MACFVDCCSETLPESNFGSLQITCVQLQNTHCKQTPVLQVSPRLSKFDVKENLMSNLESKYTLFDSVEEMLAPETLSHLLSKPVTHVDCHPFEDHGGVAGSRLSYVTTNVGRFVLKLMSSEFDWIMLSSGDQQCRAVRLWQYGLLDQLRPYMEHKILACAHHHGTWAILMDDISEYVFKGSKQMTPELISTFLDALARLHGTFWNTPYLRDPRLGLCNEAQMLALST